jgi:hypothetical protein
VNDARADASNDAARAADVAVAGGAGGAAAAVAAAAATGDGALPPVLLAAANSAAARPAGALRCHCAMATWASRRASASGKVVS